MTRTALSILDRQSRRSARRGVQEHGVAPVAGVSADAFADAKGAGPAGGAGRCRPGSQGRSRLQGPQAGLVGGDDWRWMRALPTPWPRWPRRRRSRFRRPPRRRSRRRSGRTAVQPTTWPLRSATQRCSGSQAAVELAAVGDGGLEGRCRWRCHRRRSAARRTSRPRRARMDGHVSGQIGRAAGAGGEQAHDRVGCMRQAGAAAGFNVDNSRRCPVWTPAAAAVALVASRRVRRSHHPARRTPVNSHACPPRPYVRGSPLDTFAPETGVRQTPRAGRRCGLGPGAGGWETSTGDASRS